jgi:hypothetical protein
MNTTNEKSSLDRTLGAGKPVDPATRLSELLAQSLEELTRPFDPPRPGPAPARAPGETAHIERPAEEPPAPEQSPEESRLDADKALAELEAELFAAAKQVDRDTPADAVEPPADHAEEEPADHLFVAHEGDGEPKAADAPNEADIVPPPLVPEEPGAKPDADAAGVIAKVRKLMLISMAVTVIAVGSVFGFIGYRVFKGEGTTAKTADKLPDASAIPTDITLSLPRGAKVIQSAVAADRLVITLDIDGKIEVRTFDVNTLQPAGRINFSGTP